MDSGKCLLRLRREKIELGWAALVLLLAPLGGVSAQTDDLPGDSDTAASVGSVAVLEHFVETVDSLSATFTQELWSSDQRLLETESGEFLLKRPNRFVWHSLTPVEYLVVSDGETLWMYDVELEQVTRTPLAELSAANPALLLSGDRSVGERFDTEGFRLDGRDWVRLVPKGGAGDFSSVLVAFDAGLPSELELVDGLDQTTRILFSDIAVDPEIDPDNFEFEPPPGTSVLGDSP